MKKILLSSLVAASFLSASLFAQEYSLDKAHTDIGFKIKHLQISNVKGNFKDYSAVIDFDPKTYEFKKLEAVIKVASVNTDNQTRDNHLRQDDFFKAKKYPDMTFVMKKYEKINKEKGKMTGILTIAGVSKEVVLDTEIGGMAKGKDGKEKIGFSLNGKIKRSEFKFGAGTSTLTLGDDITLSIDAEANEK
ncbi:YceI family protein [Campylobacter sp. LH-2024]|uniref:Polyisoprenoid-binding protein n=1 Tax=Campylobacter molothri TaxID=1032242 RepID=A0ACC5W0G7_9BACT|nr:MULTISPECIES: YceI family protein [unclassified Campylobacter]MBZ7927788.1 polyisoprenoid-binding protein [Campylobacter sp. RM10542]MBZ7929738.1 polyisoprenoid-binding protein [Campylobacter sp. W0067]MBZ7931124.1 polyisoprenoid-binding protein [Campylobacter sp. RM12910]MBZ7932765.1 polyisoprenoid-binding protein [Campylobacter sp. RM10543]MBZ7936912.1 polyisoprenoid-binding protein [Campylobacter sp. RM10538]MBZ7939937.1 polyisoprenoid-binding protein [Campylobacter sp. W0047]MBZ794384